MFALILLLIWGSSNVFEISSSMYPCIRIQFYLGSNLNWVSTMSHFFKFSMDALGLVCLFRREQSIIVLITALKQK